MDAPNMHAYGEGGPDDAEIGRQWRENSSLEKWFPLTAEALARLRKDAARLDRFEGCLADRAGPLLHIDDVRQALA